MINPFISPELECLVFLLEGTAAIQKQTKSEENLQCGRKAVLAHCVKVVRFVFHLIHHDWCVLM